MRYLTKNLFNWKKFLWYSKLPKMCLFSIWPLLASTTASNLMTIILLLAHFMISINTIVATIFLPFWPHQQFYSEHFFEAVWRLLETNSLIGALFILTSRASYLFDILPFLWIFMQVECSLSCVLKGRGLTLCGQFFFWFLFWSFFLDS